MFGPVVTTEAHLAFSGTRTHSNNTAEMTAMIEAFSFLGSRGPVAHDEESRIFYDSMHAAGICLGTIQARTHVQLALACQQYNVASRWIRHNFDASESFDERHSISETLERLQHIRTNTASSHQDRV